jgi:hypothetical protein
MQDTKSYMPSILYFCVVCSEVVKDGAPSRLKNKDVCRSLTYQYHNSLHCSHIKDSGISTCYPIFELP